MKKKRKRLTAEEITGAAKLYEEGKSVRAVATHYGRSYSGMYYALKKAGVAVRTRGMRLKGSETTDGS